MPYSVNDVPPAAKNLTKPQKKRFAEIANAILDAEKKKGTPMAEAESKAIAIALLRVNKQEEKPYNFVYGTVYEANIFEDENGDLFTICKACKNPNKLKKSSGYCWNCQDELLDAHGDGMTNKEVFEMQLSYMKNINEKINKLDSIVQKLMSSEEFDIMDYLSTLKHHVGLGHSIFNKDNGYLASSHCVEVPFEAFGKQYIQTIWKGGFIVNDEIFEKIKSGEYTGFSFGARGNRKLIDEGN